MHLLPESALKIGALQSPSRTIRGADEHGGQVLQLILVKGQLILVPSILCLPSIPL